jgi:hypothetical protein
MQQHDLLAVHVGLPVADLVDLVEEGLAGAGEASHPSALVADDEALKSRRVRVFS